MGSCNSCIIKSQTQSNTIILSLEPELQYNKQSQNQSSFSNDDQFVDLQVLDEIRLDFKIHTTTPLSLSREQYVKQKSDLPQLCELDEVGELSELSELNVLISKDLPSINERSKNQSSKLKNRVIISTDFISPSQTSPLINYQNQFNSEHISPHFSPLNKSQESIKSILKQKSQKTIKSQTSSKKVHFAQQQKYIHMIMPLSKNRIY